MTPPGPDPPGPDPPTPTGFSGELHISYPNSGIASATTWLQTGSNWGEGILSGSSTTEMHGTKTFTCPAGDYYIYSAPISGTSLSDFQCTMTKDGVSVPSTRVTNGDFVAWRSSSKITVAADVIIGVTVQYD